MSILKQYILPSLKVYTVTVKNKVRFHAIRSDCALYGITSLIADTMDIECHSNKNGHYYINKKDLPKITSELQKVLFNNEYDISFYELNFFNN